MKNKIHQINTNDKFKNQWGFIIACIGSSVGMANIWLFPYRIGDFGGSAFLIPYLLFVLLIGFTGVIGEWRLDAPCKPDLWELLQKHLNNVD